MGDPKTSTITLNVAAACFFCDSEDLSPPKPLLVAAMQRRRLSTVGKLSVGLLADLSVDLSETPVVFASAHGEVERCEALLQQLTASTELSPTAFSMSVHNAAAGVFSIAVKNTAMSTTVAANDHSIVMAIIEAQALMAAGASQVAVVYADMLDKVQNTWLPEPPQGNCGLAMLFTRSCVDTCALSLTLHAEQSAMPALYEQVDRLARLYATGAAACIGPHRWSVSARGQHG